jgi:hypothetical protein
MPLAGYGVAMKPARATAPAPTAKPRKNSAATGCMPLNTASRIAESAGVLQGRGWVSAEGIDRRRRGVERRRGRGVVLGDCLLLSTETG